MSNQAGELVVSGVSQDIVFGAAGHVEILQNVRMILRTMVWSVPMDRAFAGDGSIIDTPSPFQAARAMANVAEVVESNEPRVTVTKVSFVDAGTAEGMEGRLIPQVTVRVKDGVL